MNRAQNDTIYLYGFDGYENYLISKTDTDVDGSFTLSFSSADYGMGYLITSDSNPFIIVLENENIEIIGENLNIAETIDITKSKENKYFAQYATEHPRREQALSAWDFLEKIYRQDALFFDQKSVFENILKERKRIKEEDYSFLHSLPPESYVGWYLPVRKLISSTSTIVQFRKEEIPETLASFRSLDYTDNRLYKSGLYKDAIDTHFWLVENAYESLDTVYAAMEMSIDRLIENLSKDEDKLNEITEYLFDLLESRSLFRASEYLALKVLDDDVCGCSIRTEVSDKLEQYRAMKVGNTAPDFTFPKDIIKNGQHDHSFKMLSELQSDYTIVMFAASWCPNCLTEIPQVASHYSKWKEYGVDVVLVSLDTNKDDFTSLSSDLPFYAVSDFQKWESPIAKTYYVSSTPTIYLLDKELKILLKPNSVKHLDAWIDWYLAQKN